MRTPLRSLLALTLIFTLLSSLVVHGDSPPPPRAEMRGLWVASVLNIDYPAKPTTNADILRTEALNILDRAQSLGLNAVFLQVRPTADALYASRYFPWSKYLTGAQGTAPAGGFDPLAFWVEEAHKRGIELHAWVNPYRITKKTAAEPAQDLKQLAPGHPARLHPEWTVKYSDGNYYFNPGIPEVRQLVIDSSVELITDYGVDGVHFDDYFYPGKDFPDAGTYAQYGKGFASIDDWRRENVNILVRDLQQAVHAASPKARFGISPFGIWANSRTNPLGSDTKGLQSYYDHYADSLAWVKTGTVDYIAPQLYWHIGYDLADYGKLLTWWQRAVAGTGVDLYIGHGAYRAGSSDSSSPWYGTAEIERQLSLNAQTPGVAGSIFYNHKALASNTALASVLRARYAGGAGTAVQTPVTAPSVPLRVGRPETDIKTSLTQYYLTGASDPRLPLLMNGVPVTGRSPQGYFGVLVPVNPGVNTYTFSQGTASVTRTLTRSSGSSAPTPMKSAEIPAETAFPQADEHRAPGTVITLSCKAPIGATVTVALGGRSYPMTPAATKAPAAGIHATTYTAAFTLPTPTGTARVENLGAPVYTMQYGGTVKTRKAPATVGVIMPGALLYAVADQPVVNTYAKPSTSDGAGPELYRGMADRITAMTGSYIQLASGSWVSRSAVKTYTTAAPLNPAIRNVSYLSGPKWDTLRLELTSPAAATAIQSGNTLKFNIAMVQGGPVPVLPADSPAAAVTAVQGSAGLEYSLTLKDAQSLEGFAVNQVPGGLELLLKKPVRTAAGTLPLSGITVMLDPGHGGSDIGATGPLGSLLPEKTVNLSNALALKTALEQRGAAVLMTRSTDTDMTLDQRLTLSRNARPDLFISVHANSMDHNVDISKISGFSAFYREPFAQSLTQRVHDAVAVGLERGSKGVHARNFYVTRGTWAPSILLEVGFIPNPRDFELLTLPEEQARMARSVTEALIAYYSR